MVSDALSKGIGHLIGQQIAGQITTLVDAATWFSWWPGRGHNPVVWFVVAYAAYLGGLNLARYETGFGSRVVELDSRERWLSLVPFRKRREEVAKEEGNEKLGPPSN